MKKITGLSLILLLVMWLIPLNVHADNIAGDVNNDGEVNIADVNTVIDYILGDRSRLSIDVNGDGEVNGTDLVALTNVILGKTEKKTEADVNGDGQVNGTDYVTLVNIVSGKK